MFNQAIYTIVLYELRSIIEEFIGLKNLFLGYSVLLLVNIIAFL